jgi:hypothetical protein
LNIREYFLNSKNWVNISFYDVIGFIIIYYYNYNLQEYFASKFTMSVCFSLIWTGANRFQKAPFKIQLHTLYIWLHICTTRIILPHSLRQYNRRQIVNKVIFDLKFSQEWLRKSLSFGTWRPLVRRKSTFGGTYHFHHQNQRLSQERN